MAPTKTHNPAKWFSIEEMHSARLVKFDSPDLVEQPTVGERPVRFETDDEAMAWAIKFMGYDTGKEFVVVDLRKR